MLCVTVVTTLHGCEQSLRSRYWRAARTGKENSQWWRRIPSNHSNAASDLKLLDRSTNAPTTPLRTSSLDNVCLAFCVVPDSKKTKLCFDQIRPFASFLCKINHTTAGALRCGSGIQPDHVIQLYQQVDDAFNRKPCHFSIDDI